MACLREQALEGRGGAIQCDEEGCELRLKSFAGVGIIDDDPSEPDCLLQLRLRAGDSAGSRIDDPWEVIGYMDDTGIDVQGRN